MRNTINYFDVPVRSAKICCAAGNTGAMMDRGNHAISSRASGL